MRAILAPTGQGDVPTKATSGVATLLPIRRIPLREQCSISAHSFRMPPQQKNWSRKQKPILRLDIELIAAKLCYFWRCRFLLSAPATGLYLYTIISIGQGIWKRLNFLSLVLLVPFVMLALIFTPGGDATIGIIALILFACAVGFDISNVYRHVKMIRTLKRN